MRYYVTADVHGYFSQLTAALTQQGFFEDPLPHKLVICGDLFDRGEEAQQLQSFLLELLANDQLILIRGNHEDLALQLLQGWHLRSYLQPHHHSNGTIDTVCQLTGVSGRDFYNNTDSLGRAFLQTPYIQTLIPAMVDYFETDHYIFVHGWIPCSAVSIGSRKMAYTPVTDWRNGDWNKARWLNGMEAAHQGVTEPEKTIVCGHWHCSFGHAQYENDGCELDRSANFNPYYAQGIIALDACTPLSGKVNCILLED